MQSILRPNYVQVEHFKEIESVVGKKRMFAQGMVSFTRRKKKGSKRKEEKNLREKGPNYLID